jgi:hypothetical protein
METVCVQCTVRNCVILKFVMEIKMSFFFAERERFLLFVGQMWARDGGKEKILGKKN